MTDSSEQQPAAVQAASSLDVLSALQALRHELGNRRELRALDVLNQRAWERGVEARIEQAVAALPEEAGPLNSHMLVLRYLRALEELAPDHLRQLVSYLDTLVWLEEQS